MVKKNVNLNVYLYLNGLTPGPIDLNVTNEQYIKNKNLSDSILTVNLSLSQKKRCRVTQWRPFKELPRNKPSFIYTYCSNDTCKNSNVIETLISIV